MTSAVGAAGVLCCPHADCRAQLVAGHDCLTCAGPRRHRFEFDQYARFAPKIDAGKYKAEYATKYAFLWSFGYETLGTGLVEGVYRTTTSLCADALAHCERSSAVVVDCGCGVGRVSAELARMSNVGAVIGFDASPYKLDLAREILLGESPVVRSLPELGFGQELTIRGRGLRNVTLAQADAFTMPLPTGSVDLLVSMNLIDRLGHDVDRKRTLADYFAEVRRVLRTGGRFVLLSPLNWVDAVEWTLYPDASRVRDAVAQAGFRIEQFFDQLFYRELLDARGSVEEFTTAVVYGVAI